MKEYFVGVDLGGTTMKAALADSRGELLVRRVIATESHLGPEQVLSRLVTLIGQLREELAEQGNDHSVRLGGCGIGVPGLVDVQQGVTKFLPNFPTQWRDVAVAGPVREILGCPVQVMNDARVATLGELHFGHGRHFDHGRPPTMAFFSIGTGIGGGVVIDGQLRLGPLGAAGELGHQTVIPNGPLCGCGNRGCLEAIASGPAIAASGVRLLRSGLAPKLFQRVEGNADRVTTREMVQVADEDPHVREALKDAATAIGIAAANVVTVLHPDLVVLGGGVAGMGNLLIDTVRKAIEQRVGMFPTENVRVERSLLGEQAGVVGAIALALRSATSD